MNEKKAANLTPAEIAALHDRLTAEVADLSTGAGSCDKCGSALLLDSIFCHRCGHRVASAPRQEVSVPIEAMTVKLHGLYDESRREELSLALIPILADISRTIDMAHVEHIDVGALTSLVQLLEARERESKPPIDVLGMNDDVHKSLKRADFAKFFNRLA